LFGIYGFENDEREGHKITQYDEIDSVIKRSVGTKTSTDKIAPT
jgi:hypothetical protein